MCPNAATEGPAGRSARGHARIERPVRAVRQGGASRRAARAQEGRRQRLSRRLGRRGRYGGMERVDARSGGPQLGACERRPAVARVRVGATGVASTRVCVADALRVPETTRLRAACPFSRSARPIRSAHPLGRAAEAPSAVRSRDAKRRTQSARRPDRRSGTQGMRRDIVQALEVRLAAGHSRPVSDAPRRALSWSDRRQGAARPAASHQHRKGAAASASRPCPAYPCHAATKRSTCVPWILTCEWAGTSRLSPRLSA